jgi:hypothetical protein
MDLTREFHRFNDNFKKLKNVKKIRVGSMYSTCMLLTRSRAQLVKDCSMFIYMELTKNKTNGYIILMQQKKYKYLI